MEGKSKILKDFKVKPEPLGAAQTPRHVLHGHTKYHDNTPLCRGVINDMALSELLNIIVL